MVSILSVAVSVPLGALNRKDQSGTSTALVTEIAEVDKTRVPEISLKLNNTIHNTSLLLFQSNKVSTTASVYSAERLLCRIFV